MPTPTVSALTRLQHDIESAVSAPALARGYWGILVRSAASGEALYAHNAGRLLMPGSTLKIITLAAAAERLGWDYTFDTRLLATGPIDPGTGLLDGDLVVVGSGDPSIVEGDGSSSRLFAAWVEALRSLGVRTIAGRIVGDDDVFDDEPLGPGWAWEDLAGRDAAGVSGLQYNENVVLATITAGPAVGERAIVGLVPPRTPLALDNQVTTSAADTTASVVARRASANGTIELRGLIPLGGEPIARLVSVDNPTLFFVTQLRDAIEAAGIEVRGAAVDVDSLLDKPRADHLVMVAEHRSEPLSTLAVRLMKNSQNLYAETVLKTLGRSAGLPTLEGGRTVAGATLAAWGLSPDGLVQVDGSGLSRYNYLTAETLVAVLMQMEGDSRHLPFGASLPIAGRDGTLAARMVGTAAEGNARAKSGTLANVRSLAGYVTSADGEGLVFAILANSFGTRPDAAVGAIDAIVVALAEFRR